MKNKQLDTKDLLINKKEELIMFGTKVDMIQSAICQINNSVAQVGCKIDSSTGRL